MSNWKDALNDYDLTTSEGLEAVKRLFVEQSRAQQIESLKQEEAPDKILDTFGAIREYNDFIDQSERPQPVIEEPPSLVEAKDYLPDFLIDNWMPADRLTLLTGRGGAGKSYLALQHIAALALGVEGYQLNPFHGTLDELYEKDAKIFKKNPINILIASYEEDLMETWARIQRICEWLGWPDYEALRERIHFVDLKMFGPLWGVNENTHLATRSKLLDVGEWLFDQCEQKGCRLLVLDPSAGAFGGSEIARESVREFCSYLNGWGQQRGCATLLIAHPNKADDDYSGSTDWLGSCRAMWTLRTETRTDGKGDNKETFSWYQLTNVKQNYAAPQRAIYLQKIKTADDKWTPIWTACSQSDAEEFYTDYHNPTEHSTRNTPQEGADDVNVSHIPEF